ncbi:MAG: DUF4115 domain-containing protein [Candidatus Doudnabacteria bacterium]|nr:DUF4115 domain-containing protein [Candidatus Doudnabacteria bacterium]
MIFEKHKLNTETLSEYLRDVRTGLGFSIDEAVERTGVCLKYLNALEAGQYQQLPPDVYVIGFLKQIAESYKLDVRQLILQYKKERGIVEQVVNPTPQPKSSVRKYLAELMITPKLVTIVAAVLFVVGTVGYLGWQVSSISRAPSLVINSPSSNDKVLGSVVTVSGKTEPGTSLHINNQNVMVDSEGAFQTTVSLVGGQTDLRVEAKNKFDRGVTKIIPLVVEQSVPRVAGAETAIEPSVTLELSFEKAATITLSVDGEVQPQEVVGAGGTKYIQAQDKILVSTSNASAVRVKLNNNDLGLLGNKEEPLTNILFTTNSLKGFKQVTKPQEKKPVVEN